MTMKFVANKVLNTINNQMSNYIKELKLNFQVLRV